MGRSDRVGDGIDLLMITHNRPEYTRLSLTRLLDSCDETMRVWLWQNGDHEETLEIARSLSHHPRVHAFHHSPENRLLSEPTNWLWENARGDYLSKVDDDCLLPDGWGATLRACHEQIPELGVVGCWRFQDEDFVPELAQRKLREYPGGHTLLRNFWVEGSGYLLKRACVEEAGLLKEGQSFTSYCIDLALGGWIHGWYYPFIPQEHMDDPRAPHSGLKDDADLIRLLPLSARRNGVTTLAEWEAQLRRSARLVQEASIDPRDYRGWRKTARRMRRRIKRLVGVRQRW
ncbi:MAG: glycosyltransferase family A protein [Planctomycetota bacterium]